MTEKSSNEYKALYGVEYVNNFTKNQWIKRLQRLLKFITVDKSCRVVDFACASGMLMPLIAGSVSWYIGVDISDEFIEFANKKKETLPFKNVEFVCSDIAEFCSHHPGIFDVGFAMDFSEHVRDDEWEQLLESIRSSIKSNGRLYIHTPNADFFLEKMKRKNFIFKQFPEHIAVRTPAENIRILEKAGFKVCKVKLISHYNTLKIFHPMSYIPVAGKYFKARIFIEAKA